MFDIGWTEILVLATVSLFIIGPKDIPKFLGYIGRILSKIRGITSEFKETVDDAIKDSELEDIKKEISFTDPDLSKSINNIINPSQSKNEENNKVNNDVVSPKKSVKETTNIQNSAQKMSSNKEDIVKENVAGPIESLPSGLKHIRSEDKN